MGADAPQWLFSSFVDAMQEIGASAPIPLLEAEARDLISRWNAKGRILHNTRHLIKTLARIDEIASTAHDPEVLRVALWYQGAVLNRSFDVFQRGTDSDEQEFSALYHARSRMETLGLNEDVISRIQELMMALFTHRADPSDMDAQVLIDADLGMLAALRTLNASANHCAKNALIYAIRITYAHAAWQLRRFWHASRSFIHRLHLHGKKLHALISRPKVPSSLEFSKHAPPMPISMSPKKILSQRNTRRHSHRILLPLGR